MYVEVAKIQAVLDKAAANKMEKDLSSRFARVAKRFGSGITTALRRGLLFSGAGAIAGFAAMLLNPLREAEEVLNRVLGRGASATDIAAELGTDAGSYLRLETAAGMKGVDSETLQALLRRYQSAVAAEREREAKGEAPGLLRNFTAETDMAKSFYDFIRSLQSDENKDRAIVVLDEIFGRRERWRASAFLNERNLGGILSTLPSNKEFNEAANRANTIQGKLDMMQGLEESRAFIGQSKAIPENIVEIRRQSFRNQMAKETRDLQRYDVIKNSQNAMTESINELRDLATEFLNGVGPELVSTAKDFSSGIKTLTPVLKMIGGGLGTGFDRTVKAVADLSVTQEKTIRWFLDNSAIYQYFRGRKD